MHMEASMKTRLWRFRIVPYFGVDIYRRKYNGGKYHTAELKHVSIVTATKFVGKLLELGAKLDSVSFEDLELEFSLEEKAYML